MKVIAKNKRGTYDYQILDKWQAGIVLKGFEIKAIRAGKVNITTSYCSLKNHEVWLVGATIGHNPDLDSSNLTRHKLLLKRNEIRKIAKLLEQSGTSLIPLAIGLSRHLAKLEIGVGKGLKKHDKRQAIKAREARREIDRKI
ncbi:SsrA-binding protein SmpB [Candidatus Saccharibacteria bacterium]|nr:SsrA-binding protein SmpB [Candidatus Saccharibacteria bacterium]